MSIEVDKQGRVTLVTLNRPAVRNAVDAATAHALHAAFLAFERDGTADVAVFHGAGGHFCAGWDLQSGARLQAEGTSPEALAQALDYAADRRTPWGRWGPAGCSFPSRWWPPSAAPPWPVAWNWPCGAICA